MIAVKRSTHNFILGAVGLLVLSLFSVAAAAVAPVAAPQAPVLQGLKTPSKIALDAVGNIYVSDPRSGGIVVLDQYGVFTKLIRTPRPAGALALMSTGELLVAYDKAVSVYDVSASPSTEQPSKEIIPIELRKLGSGDGQFMLASAIAVDDADYIYVADAGSKNVKVFLRDGSYSTYFGSPGTLAGQFMQPSALAYDKANKQIAVSDWLNCKVQFFSVINLSPASMPVKSIVKFTAVPNTALTFVFISALAFDYDAAGALNRTYVLDAYQGQIQTVGPTGAVPLSLIGTYSALKTATDMVYDPINKRILVVSGNGYVASYGIDGGGNPLSAIPIALTIDPLSYVDGPSVTITGSVEAGAAVSVAGQPADLDQAGTRWSKIVTGLVAGPNVITVTARKESRLDNSQSVTVNALLQQVALQLTTVVPAYTASPVITVSGTTSPGASIDVGGVTGTVAADGTWTGTATLAPGPNTVKVTAAIAGLARAEKTISVIYDTPPVLAVSMVSDNSYVNPLTTGNITGFVKDDYLKELTVNGTVVAVAANGVFSTPLPSLTEGANFIKVVATDLGGNVVVKQRTINFSATVPNIVIVSPEDGSYRNNPKIAISGTSSKELDSIKIGDVTLPVGGRLTWAADVTLAEGMNTVEIVATDLNGLSTSVKRTIFLYTAKPELQITEPAQDISTNDLNKATIKGVCAAAQDGAVLSSLSYSVNGGESKPLAILDGGAYSLPVSFVDEGIYSVAVTAVDKAGNSSIVQRNIVFDKTAPNLVVNPLKGSHPDVITGTVEAGAVVSAFDALDTNPVGTITMDKNGTSWSADLTNTNYQVTSLYFIAQDAAGNASKKTVSAFVPDGDVNGDGTVNIADVKRVIEIVVKNLKPTQWELDHGDIGPMLNDKANPNGKLDIIDAVYILRRYLKVQKW